MEILEISCMVGIVCLVLTQSFTSASTLKNSQVQGFQDNDQRTRNKRNVSDIESTTLKIITTQRTELTKQKASTICFNNVTLTENGERLNNFTCPRANQSTGLVHCCGKVPAQRCCSKADFDKQNNKGKDKKKEAKDPVMKDINIVTGISIAAGFVASILICLFLYCCCCQRRHEIHDGVKLMWVRRSFGKELNRLEQPAYQDHMTVVNSITGIRESRRNSRQNSRQGSRAPSRQGSLRSNARSRPGSFNRGIGSKNPSAVPTPSISRRASHDQGHSQGHSKGHAVERHHLAVDVPSDVVITVTTPSDEHGPTAPLLKTAQQENGDEQS